MSKVIDNLAKDLIDAVEASNKRRLDRLSPTRRAVVEQNLAEFKEIGGQDFMEDVADSYYRIYESIVDGVSPKTVKNAIKTFNGVDAVVQYVKDNPEILHAIGEFLAERIAKLLLKKYNIVFPINDLYSPTIMEEISQFIVDEINERVSAKLGRDVVILKKLIPYDTVLVDLDKFLTSEINTRTGLRLTTVFNKTILLAELQYQIENKIRTDLLTKMASGSWDAARNTSSQMRGLIDELKADLNRSHLAQQQARRILNKRRKDQNAKKQASYRGKVSSLRVNRRQGENSAMIDNFFAIYKIKNEALLKAKRALIVAETGFKNARQDYFIMHNTYPSGQVLADMVNRFAVDEKLAAVNSAKF